MTRIIIEKKNGKKILKENNAEELKNVPIVETSYLNNNPIPPMSFEFDMLEIDPVMRIVEKLMEKYRREAEIITQPLQNSCKACTKVAFLVRRDTKEIVRPMCIDSCEIYKYTDKLIKELKQKYDSKINELFNQKEREE